MIKKISRKALNNELGFTLTELMVVVVILSILVGIVIPMFVNKVDDAESVKTQADIKIIQNAVDLYYFDFGNYPNSTSILANNGYLHGEPLQLGGVKKYIIDINGVVSQ